MNNRKLKQSQIIFQEEDKFNKPSILIEVVKSKELNLRDLKIYNNLLRKLVKQNIEGYQTYTIKTTISEIANDLGTTNRHDIHEALERLRFTSINFDHIKDNGKSINWHTGLIVGHGYYNEKNKFDLEIEFSKFLALEVLKHSERYAKLDLIEMNNLKSSYSLILYEHIKNKLYKYNYQKQNYTEEKLREIFNLQDKYKDIKDFNKAVIKKSIDDINTHTELGINLLKQSKKDDKRVYHLEVMRSGYNITLSAFKKVLRYLADTNQLHGTVKIKKKKYSLENQTVSDWQGKDEEIVLWVDYETGKTVSNDVALEIWEILYSDYRKNPVDFVENKLNLDSEIFFQIEAGFIK